MNEKQQTKTKTRFSNALISLLEEKRYYDITVNDICEAADMYKSTFYRYYDNKDMLLREIEKKFIAELNERSSTFFSFNYKEFTANAYKYREDLAALWDHAQKNKNMYKILLAPDGDSHFNYLLKTLLLQTYKKMLEQNDITFGQNEEYITEFLSSGLISVIYKFSCDETEYGELMDFIFKMCVYIPIANLTEK